MAKQQRPEKLPSENQAKIVGRIYQRLNQEIEKIIVAAVSSPLIKDVRFIQAQRTRILALINQAQAESTPFIAAVVRDSYIAGGKRGREWVESFIGAKSSVVFSEADQRAIELIADGTVTRLSNGLSVVGRRADDVLRAASMQQVEELSRIATSGQRVAAAGAQLEDALSAANLTTKGQVIDDAGNIGMRLININGRNFDASYYSEMVVRTESHAAHSQAMLNQFTENDWDLVQVTTHNTDCDICSEFDGQIYSISGNTEGYEVLGETPPFHPNCRHLLRGTLG